MASFYHKLTPPTKQESPLRTLRVPGNIGTDIWYFESPTINGIPQLWELTFFWGSLTTDPTVANRYLRLVKFMEAREYLTNGPTSAVCAASTTVTLSVFGYTGAITSSTYGPVTGLHNFMIDDKSGLRLWITDGKAGDEYAFIIEFKYLNRLLGVKEVLPN